MSNYVSARPVATSTLVELLRHRALHQPDRLAYTFLRQGEFEEARLTYGELDRQARAIGARLQSLNLTGERVLLLYPPGLEYIAAFLGCLYAGAVAVPAYPPGPNRSMPRIQAIVADAQTTIALTTTDILSDLQLRCAHFPAMNALQWLATDSGGVAGGIEQYWREPVLSSETLAFLQYSSGSTAAPKGVMVSHGNLLFNEQMINEACRHTEESTCV